MEGHPLEQIKKWRRINNLIKRCPNVLEIEHLILEGNEEGIKKHIRGNQLTRKDLVEIARGLKVKNYGLLSKDELIDAIKKNKGAR